MTFAWVYPRYMLSIEAMGQTTPTQHLVIRIQDPECSSGEELKILELACITSRRRVSSECLVTESLGNDGPVRNLPIASRRLARREITGMSAGRHDTCRENVMFRKLATVLSAAAVVAVTAPALAGGVDPIRVEARMSAGNDQAQAKARYRDRARGSTLEQRFDVEVEDFEPGAELLVTVNGMTVGTIFVNALGVGELQLRTAAFIDDPGDGDPIDTDFPRLQQGDSVSVGPLKGSFVDR